MIVDTLDSKHLYEQLVKETPYLYKKVNLIHKKIQQRFKKSKVTEDYFLMLDYKTPNGTIDWKMMCYIPKQNKFQKMSIMPLCEVHIDKRREFVHCNLESSFNIHQPLMLIYSAHFFKRFKERTENEQLDTYEAIFKFLFENRIVNCDYWENENCEFRMLNNWGLSLGKYIKEYQTMYFDTFINKSQLKPDQEQWIFKLIDKVVTKNDLELNHYLWTYWKNYFSEDAMNIYGKQDYDDMIENNISIYEKTKRLFL